MYKLILTRAPINDPTFNGTVRINKFKQIGIIQSNTNGELSTNSKIANSATTATTNNTPNSIVLRDENGNLPDKSYTTTYENISLTNMAYIWMDMAVSSNGQVILGIAWYNYLYISQDGGNTWKPTLQTITKPWKRCAMTKNGNIMIVGTDNEYLYMSKDSGITWSTLFINANRIWNSIAISDDGLYILAIINSSEIIKSSDGGNTWSSLTGYSNLIECVMSSNGQIQVIINNNTNNQIHISTDYGNTWTNKSISILSSLPQIKAIAINNNGNTIRVIDSLGNMHTTTNNFDTTTITEIFVSGTSKAMDIQTLTMDGTGDKIFIYSPLFNYISLDGGLTFTKKLMDLKLSIIKLSNDGSTLYMTEQYQSIYKSIDNLTTIIGENTGIINKNYGSVAMSSDGLIRAAIGNNTCILLSNDGGATWKERYAFRSWRKIVMSSNGQYIACINSSSDKIHISSDYGESWGTYGDNLSYISIGISGDGKNITAITSNKQIRVSDNFGITWSTISMSGLSASISFTSFVMSSDSKYQLIGTSYGPTLLLSDDNGKTYSNIASSLSGSRSWVNLSMSADGKYICATSTIGLFISSNNGTNFTQIIPINTNSTTVWSQCIISGDGKYMIATTNQNTVYTSSNFGVNFSRNNLNITFNSLAMSSNGEKCIGVTESTPTIRFSNDFGINWLQSVNNKFGFNSIKSSDNGQYITGVTSGNFVYVSSDNGINWTQKLTIQNWSNITMSADGKYQTVNASNNFIYVSSDYGNTWTSKLNDINRLWIGLAMSTSGQYQTATATNQCLYISSDYGEIWTQKDFPRNWSSVSMSVDGKYQSISINGPIYVSNDYGNTWNIKLNDTYTRNTRGIFVSSEGKIQIFITNNYLYISSDYGNSWCINFINSYAIAGIKELSNESFIVLTSNLAYFINKYGTVVNAPFYFPYSSLLSLDYIKNTDTILLSSNNTGLIKITK